MIRASDSISWVGRRGYGSFPVNTGDWTIFCRFKYNGAPAAAKTAQVLFLFEGDSDFSGAYLAVSSSAAATSDIDFEIFNNSTTVNSANTVITPSTQNWFALTYNATTHSVNIYVNGSVVDTLTINLSAVTWTNITGLGFSAVTDGADISVAYCRAWSRILMAGELTAEAASITASSMTGLLWDCPLQASIDLTSHNNTLNQLTATGTITTDTTDPLLSVVAGPPSNISPATATRVTVDSAYFQDVNTSSTATTVWHVCTAPLNELGAMSFGDLTTYKPTIRVYEGLANANSNTPMSNISHNIPNSPIQIPTSAGLDYYFQTVRNAAVAASTLQFSVLEGLDITPPVGSFAVNDDAPNLPLVVLDRTTGYPIKFVNPFPGGEGGSVLPSGIAAVTDDDDVSGGSNITIVTGIIITHVTSVLPDSGYQCVSDNQSDTFYSGSFDAGTGAKSKIIAVSTTGVLSTTSWNLPQSGIYTLGVDKNSTIAYYASNSGVAQPIHRYDLVNSTTLSDLVTSPAGHVICKDIVVLSDNSILVLFNQNATSLLLNQYSTTGSVVLSTNLGANTAHGIDARLARALEAGHIWVWQKLNSPLNSDIFFRVKISDGSVVETTPQTAEFEGGMNQIAANNTPARFGHSESCPFWVIQGVIPPENVGSGIYFLTGTNIDNPRVNHDTIWLDASLGTTENLAIPEPFAITYLAGDE